MFFLQISSVLKKIFVKFCNNNFAIDKLVYSNELFSFSFYSQICKQRRTQGRDSSGRQSEDTSIKY